MDDLLALFEEDEKETQQEQTNPARARNDENRTNLNADDEPPSPSAEQQQRRTQQIAATVDNQVGIRMINRKISSTDLFDMISESAYHSPASLSAMSLSALNGLLVKSAAVIDPATVCGSTNILSVGLVFSSSGTRMSSSGNYFCVLTIGNFASGPAVSVLLFGAAYGRYVRLCTPGKVVALVEPRLLPAKNGSSSSRSSTTSVTFSVSDERNLKIVADAQDFGFCKARVGGKNEYGKFVPNQNRCPKHVDLRVGEYCKAHRSQALVNSGAVKGGGAVNGLEQLRKQARAFPHGQALPPGALSAQLQQEKTNIAQQRSREIARLSSNATVGSSLRSFSQSCKPPSQAKNSILNPYATNIPNRKQPQTMISANTRCKHEEAKPAAPQPVMGDWLQEAQKAKAPPKQTVGQKRRAINMDTAAFDGSVPIPKPSKLFVRPNMALQLQHERPLKQHTAANAKSSQSVLLQQQQVAAQLRGRGTAAQPKHAAIHSSITNNQSDRSKNREDLLFGSLGAIDRSKILAAGSKFAMEVDAEEYARARQAVLELEKEEAKKDTRESSKKKKASASAVKKEWHCSTCGQSFSYKPSRCYALQHKVELRRSIETAKTITEQRQALSDKDVAEGGLTLGKGLEWNRWSRFS